MADESQKKFPPRRYRRANLSEDELIAILCRRADLVLNDGAHIVALQPNSNLFPTGISLVLQSDAFDIVPPNEEPRLYFGAIALRERSTPRLAGQRLEALRGALRAISYDTLINPADRARDALKTDDGLAEEGPECRSEATA